jgi:hypothetical protein
MEEKLYNTSTYLSHMQFYTPQLAPFKDSQICFL